MLRMLAGEAARRHGRREAFVGGGRRITFADLDRLSDSVAAGLAHRGVLPGDVVAIALPPIPEYAVCALAVAKLSAVIAGYDSSLPAEALARLHEVIEPCLTIAAPQLWLSGELVTVEPAGGRGTARPLGRLARAEPPPPPLPPDPRRPIMIITAGPADAPRGAIFGGRQLDAIRQAEAGLRRARAVHAGRHTGPAGHGARSSAAGRARLRRPPRGRHGRSTLRARAGPGAARALRGAGPYGISAR